MERMKVVYKKAPFGSFILPGAVKLLNWSFGPFFKFFYCFYRYVLLISLEFLFLPISNILCKGQTLKQCLRYIWEECG